MKILFFTTPGSKSSALRSCCPHPKTQARPHSLRRPDRVGIHLRETPTLSSSNYYTVEPSSAEGKIRNRLTSSKSFSGQASELPADLQATLDLSVTKSSSTTAHPTTTVDEEEGSEDQVEGKGTEDDFFDQAEFSDDQVDDDGRESGSIHSGDEGVPSRLRPLSTDSDSESEPGSNLTSDAGSLRHSSPKAQSGVKLKTKSLS